MQNENIAYTPGTRSPNEAQFTLDVDSFLMPAYISWAGGGVLLLIILSTLAQNPSALNESPWWGLLIVFGLIGGLAVAGYYFYQRPRPASALVIDSAAAEVRLHDGPSTVRERIPFAAVERFSIGQSFQKNGATSITYYDAFIRLTDGRAFQLASYTSEESAKALVADLLGRMGRPSPSHA